MHTWTWTQHNDNTYLRCTLLDRWHHGFFTQHWWPRLPSELVKAIAPQSVACRVKQVHGNTVLTVEEWQQHRFSALDAKSCSDSPSPAEAPLPEADGIITNQSTHAVWVATADCVPALIADDVSGRVAAVHAGWRGTSQAIVPVTIQRFLAEGSDIGNLRVALGPAIAGDVYQVSTTVAAQVGATVVTESKATIGNHDVSGESPNAECRDSDPAITQILDQLKAIEHPPILDDPQPGRVRLDVRRINELQLERIGLSAEQVAIAPYCTYQNTDRFFSYRRTRQKKVQWSGIAFAG